jgi:hypothetical protein
MSHEKQDLPEGSTWQAIAYEVPVDPMDELQCDSCQ